MVRVRDELLISLYRRGVELWVENSELRLQATKGVLTALELNEIRARKEEIIELLEQAEFDRNFPLQPRVAGCPVPLTALQLRWRNWIAKETGGLSKRICVAMRIAGVLNTDLLRTSLDAVVQRHESLRTRIVLVDGIPRQQIDAHCECALEIIDLTEQPPPTGEKEMVRIGEEFADERIDLSVGPLFAVKLFRLSNRDHALVLAIDHLITDGVSNNILCEEIWAIYHQTTRGLPPSLPALPLQFGDYAVWQQRMRGAWLKKNEAYWKERLAAAPCIQLAPDDGLTGVADPVGAMVEIPFGHGLSDRLRDVARREQTLLALVVLTIYVAVMSHRCNQRDLILAFLSNTRYRPELQGMIGFIASVLFLRIERTDEDTFLTLLQRVKEEFRSAHEHQDFGWVPDLVPECHTELHFNWLPPTRMGASTGRQWDPNGILDVQPFPLGVTWPFKFVPWFSDTATGVRVIVGYRPDLFTLSTVERFGRDLVLFAEEFSRRPFARLMSLSLAT